MAKDIRVKLFESDFQSLVKGEEVEVESLDGVKVKMILADIGFDRISYAVERAINDGRK
jgi:hypothetical protein